MRRTTVSLAAPCRIREARGQMRKQAGSGRAPGAAARGEAAGSSGYRSEGGPAPRMADLRPPAPSIAAWPTKASGPRASVQRRDLRGCGQSDGGCAAEKLAGSELPGRPAWGGVRSGAARVRHGAGLRLLEQLIDAAPPTAWSGSAAFTWGQVSERSPAESAGGRDLASVRLRHPRRRSARNQGTSPILPPRPAIILCARHRAGG
jgi:hypothetical protein